MDIDYSGIGILVSVAISMFLLYQRKSKWCTDTFRWYTCVTVFMLGLMVSQFVSAEYKAEAYFMVWCLFTPTIVNVVDRLFKQLSLASYRRDFYLWLRFSDDMPDRHKKKKKKFKAQDVFFSLTLLCLIIVLPLLGDYVIKCLSF